VRGRQFQDEPYRREPVDLLGDVSFEQTAAQIADSSAFSPARKRVYRGLRALQAVVSVISAMWSSSTKKS
jgi:hypothetical protein